MSRHNGARCGGELQGHGTQRKQTKNRHFRRQIQSSLASERSILEPKGTNRHPTKNSRAFPLVFGVKNRTMRSASSQQKIDERFPPFRGVKMGNSDRQAPRKTPKKKFTSVSPSFKGLKSKNFDRKSSQQKIDERFPPSEGLKWQFRSASDQKNAQKQNVHSAAFIARQQPAVF